MVNAFTQGEPEQCLKVRRYHALFHLAYRRPKVRRVDSYLVGTGFLLTGFLLTQVDVRRSLEATEARRQRVGELVQQLQLSDLALFTEARYTRHLSQADLHSAFQDHPLALDHFPSGSLALPPLRLERP